MFGVKTGLIAGFILSAAVLTAPGCEYLGVGQLSPEQMKMVDQMGDRIAAIDATIPQAQAELERLRLAYDEIAARGGAGEPVALEASAMIEQLQTAIDSTKEERVQLMETLGQLQASIQPDGSIDWGAATTAAIPLIAMVPGLNFIVPLLPFIGGLAGWYGRNREVRRQRIENAHSLEMAQQLSVGAIGIIDSIQTLKSRMPADSEAGRALREALSMQPQQSRFLVNAVRGNGFAGERMAPILKDAQGILANQHRK